MSPRKRIAIIGAGMGGLSAAAILSRDFEVDVYEAANGPGGKMRQIKFGGQAIDSGPTVFTMDWAFEEVFAAAGHLLDDHVTKHKLDVLARHAWSDGGRLDLYADREQSAAAIAAFAGGRDGRNYLAFCKKTRAVFETLREPFLRSQKPSFAGLLARQSPLSLLNTSPFATLWSSLSRAFEDPRLQQLFGRYATYCGASPYQAPATLMLIAHVEQEGVWALEGGMQSIAKALERVCIANGARFHYGARVQRIAVRGGAVAGVVLETGEAPADMVVMNGDASAIASGAMGDEAVGALTLPSAMQRSQSAMTWTLTGRLEGIRPDMHTVIFSDNYKAEFDAVFGRGEVPVRPTVYICAQDRAPGAGGPASDGSERLFCLINAPANGDTHPYTDEEVARCETAMHETLARAGISLTPSASPVVTTPNQFATMFPATGGAIYGMASHGWRASFQRPGARTRVKGLYMAGGSVHPGPGAPMAALSGKAAASALISDCGSTSPSRQMAMPGGISTP